MHQLERTLRCFEYLDRAVDVLQVAHPRGDEGVLPLSGHRLKELLVHRHGGGNLVVLEVELLEEPQALGVPGGGEPIDAELTAVAIDLLVLFLAELEAFLLRPLRGAPGAFSRRVQQLARVHELDGPLLELDGIAAGFAGDLDQLLGDVDVPIVVDADLSNDEDAHPLPLLVCSAAFPAPRRSGRWLPAQTSGPPQML